MSLLDKLERKLQRYAIPNITLYLIMGQVFFYAASMTRQFDILRIVLIPDLVLAGEWWRLITFIFIPPFTNPFFIFFVWYLYYLMGTALEGHWGAFRYNLFLLIGYIFTVTASFLIPGSVATNVFFFGSVILAFAALYPEFQLYILFILPVKMKWLALITWIGYGWQLLTGSWETRLLVLASIGNFLLFFGRDILWKIKTGRRKMASQVREISGSKEAFHRCTVCGVTDRSDPKMEFRYCPECGGRGYCKDHIVNHEHLKK
jgi:hypothetical protein